MRILIFIEHDIIFRHFYLSNAFKDIETEHDVKYIFPREQSKKPRFNINPKNYGIKNTSFNFLDENQHRVHFWKKIYRIEIIQKGFEREVVRKVLKLLRISEYKRFQAPPGPKLGKKAFGRDRMYPLTNKF